MKLFIFPRIHQNVVSEFIELVNFNESFKIICLNKSKNDKKFNPYIIRSFPFLSFFSRFILGELPNNGFIIPSFSSIVYIFNSIKVSKTVVMRELRFPVTLTSLLIIFFLRKDLILRIQHPSHKLPLTYLL